MEFEIKFISVLGGILFFIYRIESRFVYIKNPNHNSWKDAQSHCISINGSLISSNELDQLKKCHDTIHSDFWVGKYKTLSSWMDIVDCHRKEDIFSIADYNETIEEASPALCQQMCSIYPFFGLKYDRCVCMKRSIHSTTEVLGASNCNNTCSGDFAVGLCGGNNHFTVYDRVVGSINSIGTSFSCNPCKCVIGGCSTYGIYKNQHDCMSPNKISCRHNEYNGDQQYNSWKKNLQMCHEINDYLTRYNFTNVACSDVSPFYTSAFRDFASVDAFDKQSNTPKVVISVHQCMVASYNGLHYITRWLDQRNCESKKAYVCNILGGNDDCVDNMTASVTSMSSVSTSENSTLSFFENQTALGTSKEQSAVQSSTDIPNTSSTVSNYTMFVHGDSIKTPKIESGPIIGGVVSVVLLTLIATVIFIIWKKRLFSKAKTRRNKHAATKDFNDQNSNAFLSNDNKDPKTSSSKRDISNAQSTTSSAYDNSAICLYQPETFRNTSKNKEMTTNFDFAKQQTNGYSLANLPESDSNQLNIETGYDLAKVQESNKTQNTSEYEFADPLEFDYSGPDYIYTETKEGEYDTLHSQKRKVHNNGNNVYAHTNAGNIVENEYDTTHAQFKQDMNHYDHTNFKLNDYEHTLVGHNNVDHDPYDHSSS